MKESTEKDNAIIEKAFRRLKRYDRESRLLTKRSEDYKVLEEVFDRPTLFTLHHLINSKIFKYLNGVVNSGKEARIYWGVRESETDVAVKIFLTVSSDFRRRLPYIVGDPRFKRVKKGIKNLVNIWARKEYRNLITVSKVGINCPKPIIVKRNVLVMEFIGENGKSAPTLNEVKVSKRDYERTLSIIHKLYRNAELVHSDLSEYNIFKFNRRLIVFDFGSAVNISHPNSEEFLKRDINNINLFFNRRDVDVLPNEEILMKVKRNKF
jgi:RIO kinase 1